VSPLCPTCGQTIPEGQRSRAILPDAELDALSAWWHMGSIKGAADLLSRSERTVINQLYSARIRNDLHRTVELAQLYLGSLRSRSELLTSHKNSRRKAA
jgi:hypothetical protein